MQACWSCQVELERLKDQIAVIIDAQTTVVEPASPPPPNIWPRLEPRLERAKEGNRVPFWKRFIPFVTGAPNSRLAWGGAALAFASIVLLVWLSGPPASAKEVLRRVMTADARRMRITAQ